jgi:hypothetical protein
MPLPHRGCPSSRRIGRRAEVCVCPEHHAPAPHWGVQAPGEKSPSRIARVPRSSRHCPHRGCPCSRRISRRSEVRVCPEHHATAPHWGVQALRMSRRAEVRVCPNITLLPLYPCTLVPLYPCTLVPLYPCTLVPLYPCTRVPLYPCTLVPLYPCTLNLYPCTLVPLYPCTLVPLHPCTLVPLYPCTLVPLYPCALVRYPGACAPVPLNCTLAHCTL